MLRKDHFGNTRAHSNNEELSWCFRCVIPWNVQLRPCTGTFICSVCWRHRESTDRESCASHSGWIGSLSIAHTTISKRACSSVSRMADPSKLARSPPGSVPPRDPAEAHTSVYKSKSQSAFGGIRDSFYSFPLRVLPPPTRLITNSFTSILDFS